MSQAYNPEAEIIARIESLEQRSREIRRRVEHARTVDDKRALNRQLQELNDEMQHLRLRLP